MRRLGLILILVFGCEEGVEGLDPGTRVQRGDTSPFIAPDTGPDTGFPDTGFPDASCSNRPDHSCVFANGTACCGDFWMQQICSNGSWVCSPGTIPWAQCTSHCEDRIDAGFPDAACSSNSPDHTCVFASGTACCGDALQMQICDGERWVCPMGMIPWGQCSSHCEDRFDAGFAPD